MIDTGGQNNLDDYGRLDVLIVTASVGAGHNQAAKAVKNTLESSGKKLKIGWVDLMNLTGRAFTAFYRGGYAKVVSHFPKMYGRGYRFWDVPQSSKRPLREKLRLMLENRALVSFKDYVRKVRPKVILHTHFLAPAVIGRMSDFNLLDTKQFVVVTDYLLHRFWYAENVHRYFTASDSAIERLSSFGIDKDKITLSGIPVHQRWYDLPACDKLRKQWNFEPDKRIVTITAGADFTLGNVYRLAKDLLAARSDIEVIALAGSNKKLLVKLSELSKTDSRLRGYGFTDKINELIAMSDLVLTKSGGLMTTECITAGKAMVFFPSLPGQEAGNAEYLSSCGAALAASSSEQMIDMTLKLLDDPSRIAGMSEAAANLRKKSADIISDCIFNELEKLG